MRLSCLDCARKHLAQAAVLADEVRLGYPDHMWLVIGHMAEAESELVKDYLSWASIVREKRLAYMNEAIEPDFLNLILELTKVANQR